MADDRLLSTGEAARAVGVSRRTLAGWAQEGLVRPALRTAGGHARWALGELRGQLEALEQRQEP